MKWHRLVLALAALVVLATCEAPTVPRYPRDTDEEEKQETDSIPTQGLLLQDLEVFWA